MNGMKCPTCAKGRLEKIVIPEKNVTIEGIALHLTDVHALKCSACGEESFPAAELKRWKQLKNERLSQVNQVPSPDRVKKVRQQLNLSVADFGALMGVTRQAVYAWEDPAKDGMKFGPPALLIALLDGEGTANSTYSQLLELAHARGQLAGLRADAPELPSRGLPCLAAAIPVAAENGRPHLRRPPNGGTWFHSPSQAA